jgi:hypothetical protein
MPSTSATVKSSVKFVDTMLATLAHRREGPRVMADLGEDR